MQNPTSQITYDEFEIHVLQHTPSGYPICTHSSRFGDLSTYSLLDPSADWIEDACALIERRQIGARDLEQFGALLLCGDPAAGLHGLLRSQLMEQLRTCMGAVLASSERCLQLRLRIEPAELAVLPWEYLFDPVRQTFLASDPRFLMFRTISAPRQVASLRTSLPLRGLLIAADAPDLYLNAELEELLTLSHQYPDLIQWDILGPSITFSEIQARLQTHPFQLLHFCGHGEFARHGLAHLKLTGAHSLTERNIADLAHLNASLRLVVLNACESGRSDPEADLSGMAVRLLYREIPAVVVMRQSISDHGAILFAKALYERLLLGPYPGDVASAVNNARAALLTHSDAAPCEFGIPSLFLRATQTRLFALATPQSFSDPSDLPMVSGRTSTSLGLEQPTFSSPQPVPDLATGGNPASSRQISQETTLPPLGSGEGVVSEVVMSRSMWEPTAPNPSVLPSTGIWERRLLYLLPILMLISAPLFLHLLPAAGGRQEIRFPSKNTEIGKKATVMKLEPVSDTPIPQANVSNTPARPGVFDDKTMVLIPAGEFGMGCYSETCELDTAEHKVHLSSYAIDRTEVSAAEYEACVRKEGCTEPDIVSQNCTYRRRGYAQHPINCVTWRQAEEYCSWAGKRLPTEAQWEKAARGEDAREYPWGNMPPDCIALNASSCRPSHEGARGRYSHLKVRRVHGPHDSTSPVESHPAGVSPYGALDMAGNVAEWVADWYGDHPISPQKDPIGPETGVMRVVKGGSYLSVGRELHTYFRNPLEPTEPLDYVGFRCASPLAAAQTPP